MEKKELLQFDVHDDFTLWNLISIAKSSVHVLLDYVQSHRKYDKGACYNFYKNKVVKCLAEFEDLIALTEKKED